MQIEKNNSLISERQLTYSALTDSILMLTKSERHEEHKAEDIKHIKAALAAFQNRENDPYQLMSEMLTRGLMSRLKLANGTLFNHPNQVPVLTQQKLEELLSYYNNSLSTATKQGYSTQGQVDQVRKEMEEMKEAIKDMAGDAQKAIESGKNVTQNGFSEYIKHTFTEKVNWPYRFDQAPLLSKPSNFMSQLISNLRDDKALRETYYTAVGIIVVLDTGLKIPDTEDGHLFKVTSDERAEMIDKLLADGYETKDYKNYLASTHVNCIQLMADLGVGSEYSSNKQFKKKLEKIGKRNNHKYFNVYIQKRPHPEISNQLLSNLAADLEELEIPDIVRKVASIYLSALASIIFQVQI